MDSFNIIAGLPIPQDASMMEISHLLLSWLPLTLRSVIGLWGNPTSRRIMQTSLVMSFAGKLLPVSSWGMNRLWLKCLDQRSEAGDSSFFTFKSAEFYSILILLCWDLGRVAALFLLPTTCIFIFYVYLSFFSW